jgi:hypothetical protein
MQINRFDEIEYEILIHANPDGFGVALDNPHKDRALLLMKEGILVKNPYKNWLKTGWNLTPEGLKYRELFINKLRKQHGHEWLTLDECDKIDSFAYSSGFHNGPRCKKCGYEFCKHCTSEFVIDECIKK